MLKCCCAEKIQYSQNKVQKFSKERKESMFGKNVKETSDLSAEAGSERLDGIIDRIMRFTGAKNIDELEDIVNFATDAEKSDELDNDSRLFEAVSAIKNNHSILEAKEMEKNEDFVNAVLAGFEPEKAYKLAKCEELINAAYADGEEHGKAAVKAKEDRIGEVGMTVTGGYKAEIDPSKMTMEDLKKIKERLRKGENVRI